MVLSTGSSIHVGVIDVVNSLLTAMIIIWSDAALEAKMKWRKEDMILDQKTPIRSP